MHAAPLADNICLSLDQERARNHPARPEAVYIFYFQVRIDLNSTAFFLAWNTI